MNDNLRPATNISHGKIAREWDGIARARIQQIQLGKDISFSYVLLPTILRLSAECDHSNVIDVGCGSGALTNELAGQSRSVVGVDMSTENIEVARELYGGTKNIAFVVSKVEEYATTRSANHFSLAVANMSLMTAPDLDGFLRAVARLLRSGGHLVLTITHPYFWPLYWNYAFEDWFDYKREIAIEGPFRISLDTSSKHITTHIHRPLEQYVRGIVQAGFVIDELHEPMPDAEVEAKYPRRWTFPRFLAMRCVKT